MTDIMFTPDEMAAITARNFTKYNPVGLLQTASQRVHGNNPAFMPSYEITEANPTTFFAVVRLSSSASGDKGGYRLICGKNCKSKQEAKTSAATAALVFLLSMCRMNQVDKAPALSPTEQRVAAMENRLGIAMNVARSAPSFDERVTALENAMQQLCARVDLLEGVASKQ